MSHITSLPASFPCCGLVKTKTTFVPVVSGFVAVIFPGVLACLPFFCGLALGVAGRDLTGVPAGHMGDVLIDGAVQAIQPAGDELAEAGAPGNLEKEGCRATSAVTTFPSAPTQGPVINGNPSPGLAV